MFYSNFDLKSIINSMIALQSSDDDVFMLLVGEHTKWDVNEFIEAANNKDLVFFGGIFPEIISGSNKYSEGVIIKKYPSTTKPILQTNINLPDFKLQNITDVCVNCDNKKSTAIILLDGLSNQIAKLLEELHLHFGDTVNYVGGGAGSLTLIQKPSVFCNEGIFQDAAIITIVDNDASLGVKHGWEKVVGPFIATKTDKNIIKELNWENPFDVYKRVIFEDSGRQINVENFFSIAKSYPFGITKENSEYVVRDPLAVNDKGELICVGEVVENTVLDILKGEQKTLIDAAQAATLQAVGYNNNYSSALIFDCISRTLFLESDFNLELEAAIKVLNKHNCNFAIEGALSLGEISSAGQGYLEFFNKTFLISLFYE